jgi:hypothetical protein
VEVYRDGTSYTLAQTRQEHAAWLNKREKPSWWQEQSFVFSQMKGMWLPPRGADKESMWWGWLDEKDHWVRLCTEEKGWISREAGDQWFGFDEYLDAAGARWHRNPDDRVWWWTFKANGAKEWWEDRKSAKSSDDPSTVCPEVTGGAADLQEGPGVADSLGAQSDSDLSYTTDYGTVWKRYKTTDRWWWTPNTSKIGTYKWWKEQPAMPTEDGTGQVDAADVPVCDSDTDMDLHLE